MIRKTVLLSLGLALLGNPAEAGDWNNGAGVLKDSGGMAGVPVPAPVPIAQSFTWYVRADLGYTLGSSGTVTSTNGYGISHSADYGHESGPFLGGIGAGRYMTPTMRWDITADYRAFQKSLSGASTYTATTTTLNGGGPGTVTNTFAGTRGEEIRTANHTFLFNLYHDFNRGGGINPYVGAGLGVTVRETKTQFTDTAVCTQSIDNTTGLPFAPPCMQPSTSNSANDPRIHFGLAAALMTGLTYEVAPGVLIDGGYRLAWEGGNSTMTFSPDKITAGPRLDHEIRAGMRWNVW